jgi:hypothetical protein
MRAALILIGVTMSFSASAFADDAIPEPQQATTTATPLPQQSDKSKVVCHNQIHEGVVTQIVQCGNQEAWNRTRQETAKTLRDIQVRSYATSRR